MKSSQQKTMPNWYNKNLNQQKAKQKVMAKSQKISQHAPRAKKGKPKRDFKGHTFLKLLLFLKKGGKKK